MNLHTLPQISICVVIDSSKNFVSHSSVSTLVLGVGLYKQLQIWEVPYLSSYKMGFFCPT